MGLGSVSEAPTSEDELRSQRAIHGRFRYSDLKEAALRGELWDLYGPEPIYCLFARTLFASNVGTDTNGRL